MIYKVLIFVFFSLIFVKTYAQYEFLSPIPESKYHTLETNIIFRDGAYIDESSLVNNICTIYSFMGGYKSSVIKLSSDGKTVIFDPVSDFDANDTVRITIQNIKRVDQTTIDSISFIFYTTNNIAKNSYNNEIVSSFFPDLYNVKSIPENFPSITTLTYDNPYEGYIFFQNTSGFASNNDRFISIIDHNLNPYMYIQDNSRGLAFTKQKNGFYSFYNPYSYSFYLLDTTSFSVIDSFACGNGYNADFHDFQILENGHSYLFTYDIQTVDMSVIVTGGDPAAQVTGVVLQELDQDKNVILQWRTWDYFEITDALHFIDFTSHYIAYAHTNSIDVDEGGNILISNYLMDEITYIDGNTGEIIWRLGGKNNQFTFANDTIGFTTQHDVRRLPNGNITLYDNGLFHDDVVSSAKEYQLDEINKTANLVWSYTHPLHFSCPRSGNVQRLPNGNTFINWGWRPSVSYPSMTEVTLEGTIVHEISFDTSDHLVYRGYKFIVDGSTDIIEDKSSDAKTLVYPNPASEIVNISFPDYFKGGILSIKDISGRDISKYVQIELYKSNLSYKVDCSLLPSGLYFYSMQKGEYNMSGKFMIAR